MTNRNHGLARLAVLTLGCACLAPAGAQAADGTIHFQGEIVAAPYELRAAPAADHRVRTAGPASAATEVIFLRQQVDRPSATVRVDALGAQPLAVTFTDARARRHVVDAANGQAIGQDGGTLSIRPAGAATTGMALAMVTVDYN